MVPGILNFGLLLTRGCDIDHGRLRQVAAIRPLAIVSKVDDQEAVIQGKHTSMYFLPAAHVGELRVFDRSFVAAVHHQHTPALGIRSGGIGGA